MAGRPLELLRAERRVVVCAGCLEARLDVVDADVERCAPCAVLCLDEVDAEPCALPAEEVEEEESVEEEDRRAPCCEELRVELREVELLRDDDEDAVRRCGLGCALALSDAALTRSFPELYRSDTASAAFEAAPLMALISILESEPARPLPGDVPPVLELF